MTLEFARSLTFLDTQESVNWLVKASHGQVNYAFALCLMDTYGAWKVSPRTHRAVMSAGIYKGRSGQRRDFGAA